MGCDVVQIGLGHNLPVEDPRALAREVSQRLGWNIQLGYWERMEYNETERCLKSKPYSFIEMDRFVVDKSTPFYMLSISDYEKYIMRERFSQEELKQIHYSENYLRSVLLQEYEPYELYVLESTAGASNNVCISFFKENVDLDVYQTARWFGWLSYFESDENQQLLYDYRKAVAERARAFGCSCVVFFADQGVSQRIYKYVPLPSRELIGYINNRTYLFEDNELTEQDRREWLEEGKIIQYADYFEGKLALGEKEFIDIIYDDFRNLDTSIMPKI